MKKTHHIIVIILIINIVLFLGPLIPINLGFLNPFKKGVSDYDATDLIYSKFKNPIAFDDRIAVVNVGKPDRNKIAKCIEVIQNNNPLVVGIDVIFEGKKDSVSDDNLAKTIKAYQNIVLSDVLNENDISQFPNLCLHTFCEKQNTGYVNFVAKPDHNIRFISPYQTVKRDTILSFTSYIVKKYSPEAYKVLMERGNDVERINYRGNSDSYVQYEINDILDSKTDLTNISNKIVLLGYTGVGEWSESSKDKFYTPLNKQITLKSLPDMFGVFVHANVLSMILDNHFINKSSKTFDFLLAFIVITLMVIFLRNYYYTVNPGYWKTVRFIQLAVFFTLFVLSIFAFYFLHFKIDMTKTLVGVILSWDVLKIYEGIFVKKQKFFQKTQ